MMPMGRAILVAALLAAGATPAAAQDQGRRVSVRIGAGAATPFHGDFDFTASAWEASVRAALSPRVAIEGFFGEWRHTTTRVTTDTIVQGPGGVLGRIGKMTQRTQHVRPEAGFNMLVTGSMGRVTVSAGGGPGVLLYRRQFTQVLEGCEGAAVRCEDTDRHFSSGSFSMQAVAGVDVAIASRIGAFGEFRLSVPVEDVGSGQTAVVGGLRVAIW